MPITDEQLDKVVMSWNLYAQTRPEAIDVNDVLKKRDLNMYRGLGIENIVELALKLVEDRSVASMEMTMGHLYERVLEEIGPRKISTKEKRLPGMQGIDFVEDTPTEHRLVNLKSSLSTPNGDIDARTKQNLENALKHWESNQSPDDNPIAQTHRVPVPIKAVARGTSKTELTEDGILWLVGDDMWQYFGGGPELLKRLSDALGRNPLDFTAYTGEIEYAAVNMRRALSPYELPGEEIDWDKLLVRFP